jgi:hypothetical protein
MVWDANGWVVSHTHQDKTHFWNSGFRKQDTHLSRGPAGVGLLTGYPWIIRNGEEKGKGKYLEEDDRRWRLGRTFEILFFVEHKPNYAD